MFARLTGLNRIAERRSIENPNVPFAAAFLESIGSESGEAVTGGRSLTIPAVWQAVNMISGDVAKLPLNVLRRLDGSTQAREIDEFNPVQVLIRRRPNAKMYAFKFWRRLMVHVLIWNNAFAWIRRDATGVPIELLPLLPDRTTFRTDEVGERLFMSELGGRLIPFRESEIFHVEGISVEGAGDCNLVVKARTAWGLNLARMRFSSRFFRHGGRIGGTLEIPTSMTKKGADALEEGFRKKYEDLDSTFRTVVLRDNAKFHAGQFSPEQAQLVETGEAQARDVARFYQLHPSRLGVQDSISYNSLEQANRAYLDSTLSHWLKAIAGEANLKLLPESLFLAGDLFCEHDVEELIQADIETQTEVARKEIVEMGTLSRDEYRARRNRLPREDGGGGFVQSVNVQPQTQPQPRVGQPPAPDDDEDNRSLKRDALSGAINKSLCVAIEKGIHESMTRLRREVRRKKPRAFQEWLSRFAWPTMDRIDGPAEAYAGLSEQLKKEFHDVLFSELDGCLNSCSEHEDLIQSVEAVAEHHRKTLPERLIKLARSVTCDY